MLESILPEVQGSQEISKITSIDIPYEDDRVLFCVTNHYRMFFSKANAKLLYVDPEKRYSFNFICFGFNRKSTKQTAIYYERAGMNGCLSKDILMRYVTDGIKEAKTEKSDRLKIVILHGLEGEVCLNLR